jgi:excisionase family DNA binding protein
MELSASEASARLGLSQRWVQRLVTDGKLPTTKRVGKARLADAAAADRLGVLGRRHGRPWAVGTAWSSLWLPSSLDADWVGRQTKYRLRRRLEATTPDSLAWACRGRADVTNLRTSESFLAPLRSRLAPTGSCALDPARDLMTPSTGTVDGYCAHTTWAH